MSAPHTLVFLDVDGTIAPVGGSHWGLVESGWEHWQAVRAAGMPVLVATGVLDALRRIATLPGVEIRWLTDWSHDATALGEQLGLGPFTVAGGSVERDGFDYKSAVILRDLEHTGVRRFVWLDDNAPGFSRNLTVTQHEALEPTLNATEKAVWSAGDERLIIGPWTSEGLTPDDMLAVEEFCRR